MVISLIFCSNSCYFKLASEIYRRKTRRVYTRDIIILSISVSVEVIVAHKSKVMKFLTIILHERNINKFPQTLL